MKTRYFVLMLLLAVISLSCPVFARSALIKDEVVLSREADTYMEVRHYVLKGSNKEIGKTIGEIVRTRYGSKLIPYADPVYARARKEYMRLNYPILYERMKGVAQAYGLAFEDNTFDISNCYYDLGPLSCSAVFFPSSRTTNGHNIVARNMEWYLVNIYQFIGMPANPAPNLFSNVFVMELYPDKGYPSLVIGTHDLLNCAFDGMNSKGLTIHSLVDSSYRSTVNFDVAHAQGISNIQIARLVLDTCATVAEAKQAFLNNKLFMFMDTTHFLVTDRSGRSCVVEYDGELSTRFVDNKDGIQIIANRSLYNYPSVESFPATDPNDHYNSFNRHRRLDKFVKEHPGKFSPEEMKTALSMVYGYGTDKTEVAGATEQMAEFPIRTVWSTLFDNTDRSVTVKFYLKDGTVDPATKRPSLIFSQPYKFKLAD